MRSNEITLSLFTCYKEVKIIEVRDAFAGIIEECTFHLFIELEEYLGSYEKG